MAYDWVSGEQHMTHTTKHTPGPWEVTGPHSREVITTTPGTYRPCMTIAKVKGYWDGEAQANAHLIAAAPAMYEALRAIVGQQTPNRWGYDAAEIALSDEWRAQARAALAQAEGLQ